MKKLFIAITLILTVTYGIPLFFNESILLYFGDSIETMYPYFVHLSEQIRSGNMFQWNQSMGFGTNNLVNFFNGLGSPFVYIAALFPRSWIPHLFLFFDVIRFYAMAYFAWLWSGKLFQKEETRFVFSLAFVFSGWVMHFIHFGFYLDGYMYLPLLLYLSDEVIEGRKAVLFVFVTAFTAFISPYFLYMHSIYMLMYQIFRFTSRKSFSFKALGEAFLKVFCFYLLGIGVAAIVLLPEIDIVLSSPRVDIGLIDKLKFDFSPYRLYNLITSFFSPVLNDYNPNLFYSRYNVLDKSIFYNFTSVLTLIALVNLPWMKFTQKRAFLTFFGVLIVLNFIPIANIFLNGNDNVRWHFMLSTTALIGLGYYLDNKKTVQHSWMGMSIVLAYGIIYFVSRKYNLIDQEFFRTQFVIIAVVVGMSLIYVVVLRKATHSTYLTILLTIEMIFIILFRMNNGLNVRYIKADDFQSLNKANDVELFESLTRLDPDFERIDVFNAYGNDAIMNGFPGFTFYSSLYNHEIRTLLDERFTVNWNMGFAPSKMILKHFSGSKYFVTEKGFENAPFGFEFLNTEKEKDIYRQKFDNGFGYAFENTYDIKMIKSMDKSLQDFYMFQGPWTEHGIGSMSIEEPESVYLGFQNEYVDFTEREQGYYVLDFSRSNPSVSCQLDYYKDGEIKTTQYLQEYGYSYISVNKDYDGFFAYCTSVYNMNEYVPSNVYFVTNQYLNQLYSGLEQRPMLREVINQNDYIQADITVDIDSTIVTVIAYDKGWQVKVDGNSVETFKVNDGFLGFRVSSGYHLIEMQYDAPGLSTGIMISSGSIFILMVYGFLKRKQ